MNEIERKFLIKHLPDISRLQIIPYERHFIYLEQGTELRIQHKGANFELERKSKKDYLSAEKSKLTISESEFEFLKKYALKSIVRDGYQYSENPEISIKVYHGQLEGFMRVEVEFGSEEEARGFNPPAWFGPEITGSELDQDSKLVSLSRERLASLLKEYSQ